jgi:hypothetical protein
LPSHYTCPPTPLLTYLHIENDLRDAATQLQYTC